MHTLLPVIYTGCCLLSIIGAFFNYHLDEKGLAIFNIACAVCFATFAIFTIVLM